MKILPAAQRFFFFLIQFNLKPEGTQNLPNIEEYEK